MSISATTKTTGQSAHSVSGNAVLNYFVMAMLSSQSPDNIRIPIGELVTCKFSTSDSVSNSILIFIKFIYSWENDSNYENISVNRKSISMSRSI